MTTAPRIALDVGLLVADMTRALSFYHDLLGLPVQAETRTSLIGQGSMVQLRYGNSLIKLIELDMPPTTTSPKGLAASLGLRYLTLLLADIRPMMAKLEQHGTRVVQPVTKLGNGTLIAMVEDMDGNIVELVQEA